jgi:hypothetical protein
MTIGIQFKRLLPVIVNLIVLFRCSNVVNGAALNRYFVLLKQYFPQHNSAYAKDLNMGEFVHFWSGVAGYDLRKQAEKDFISTENKEKLREIGAFHFCAQ